VSDASLVTPGALISSALRDRGLTLDDLAQSTRLRRGLLEQMEADDFFDTGGDVYARGHLRVIAGVLDIDADDLLAAYDEAPSVRRPPAP
jgi:cytoskeleton protein RodZ